MIRSALLALLVACGASSPAPAPLVATTLYERIGRRDALVAIVDDFVATASADARITHPLDRAALVSALCAGGQGPCAAATSLQLPPAELSALVEHVQRSLDKFKVQPREQHDLLKLLSAISH